MMDEKDLWPINKPVWDYLDGGGFHLDDGLLISLVHAPFVQHWDAVADHHFGAAEPFPDLPAFGAVGGDVAAEFDRDIVDLRPGHGITSR